MSATTSIIQLFWGVSVDATIGAEVGYRTGGSTTMAYDVSSGSILAAIPDIMPAFGGNIIGALLAGALDTNVQTGVLGLQYYRLYGQGNPFNIAQMNAAMLEGSTGAAPYVAAEQNVLYEVFLNKAVVDLAQTPVIHYEQTVFYTTDLGPIASINGPGRNVFVPGTGLVSYIDWYASYSRVQPENLRDDIPFYQHYDPSDIAEASPTVFGGLTHGDGPALFGIGGSATVLGNYGDLVLSYDGIFKYEISNTNSLPYRTHPIDAVTAALVTVNGGLPFTLTFAFNRAPIIDDLVEIAESGGLSVPRSNGILAVASDPDGDELTISRVNDGAFNAGIAVHGQFGALTLNVDGSYSYRVDNGHISSASHDVFSVSVFDGQAETTINLDILVPKNDGDETLFATSDGSYLFGGDGNDILMGAAGPDILVGGLGNDVIFGALGDDRLDGGAGADVLDGGDGNDTVDYSKSPAPLTVTLEGGGAAGGDADNDTLISIENVIGTSFNDLIIGNAQGNELHGGGGNDVLAGLDGDDTLDGGDGVDFLTGGLGNDTLYGGAGGDALHGQEGNDIIVGGDGNDVGIGFTGDDVLYGEAGDDTLIGDDNDDAPPGADILHGGDGNDQLFGYAGNDILLGDAGDDFLAGGAGDDNLSGGTGGDALFGDDGADLMHGDDGDDVLVGGAGADQMFGDAGNDTLIGLDGNDTMSGGAGNDQMFGYAGIDTMNGDDGDDFLAGGAGGDTLSGGAGGDVLDGEDGNDTLDGGDDGDNINGNMGNDTIFGGAGNDGLLGWDGDDVIDGGSGNDYMYGDRPDGSGVRGNDTFVFRAGSGNDLILDFETGTGAPGDTRHDVIDIRDYHFADFNAVMTAATDVNGGTYIQLDADDAIFLHQVPKATLIVADFILA